MWKISFDLCQSILIFKLNHLKLLAYSLFVLLLFCPFTADNNLKLVNSPILVLLDRLYLTLKLSQHFLIFVYCLQFFSVCRCPSSDWSCPLYLFKATRQKIFVSLKIYVSDWMFNLAAGIVYIFLDNWIQISALL